MIALFLKLILAVVVLSWAWLALGYHATGGILLALRVVLIGAGAAVAISVFQDRALLYWLPLLAVVALGGVWWQSETARLDRVWAADVAHGVTAEVDGTIVTLHNVRNFDWQTKDSAVERWETRVVDHSQVVSADMIMSVWDSPAIAHTLVSFGFADGQHIAFSAEIRRERDEKFSALGGFFKKYELVMIAAEESDIVRLRTDMRGEQVSLFPVDLPEGMAEQLFLSFIEEANRVNKTAHWYHTLLANCTTVPFKLVRAIAPGLGFDWRVVASGYLPGYLHELGVVRPDLTLADVLERGRLAQTEADGAVPKLTGPAYSAAIRAKWAD